MSNLDPLNHSRCGYNDRKEEEESREEEGGEKRLAEGDEEKKLITEGFNVNLQVLIDLFKSMISEAS